MSNDRRRTNETRPIDFAALDRLEFGLGRTQIVRYGTVSSSSAVPLSRSRFRIHGDLHKYSFHQSDLSRQQRTARSFSFLSRSFGEFTVEFDDVSSDGKHLDHASPFVTFDTSTESESISTSFAAANARRRRRQSAFAFSTRRFLQQFHAQTQSKRSSKLRLVLHASTPSADDNQLNSLCFSLFSRDEIKKISICSGLDV